MPNIRANSRNQILQIQFFFFCNNLILLPNRVLTEIFRMSIVRQVRYAGQVPRVLRKDYASMRWWNDQQPLETQDKSISTVSFPRWLVHNYFVVLVPWWFLGSIDSPMVLHWTKTLDELPIWSSRRETSGRTSIWWSSKIHPIQHLHLLR